MKPAQDTQILIVEDDPLVAVMIKGLLQKRGYVIAGHALDGEQAVELAQALRPDVILMDIEMPKLDGIQAARQISQVCPTPVVILTAYESPEFIEKASQAGAGAYLVKPPKIRELERAIIIAMARFEDMQKLQKLNDELKAALERVKMLSGLLPICADCKKIRNDEGYWEQVEVYLHQHADVDFSHGLCPDCLKKYTDLAKENE
ncbi:MAG: response regulator [Chloroflexi bacterium]|nr:MAG: response regulator [Chloroflexota bacterium]